MDSARYAAPAKMAKRLNDPTSYRWFFFALLIYACVAFGIGRSDFPALLLQYVQTLLTRLPFLLGPVCAIGLLLRLRSESISDAVAHLRSRAVLLSMMAIALLLALTSYTTLKIQIPDLVPFYADEWAARLDMTLHADAPWIWTHAVWPDAWSETMFFVYGKLWFAYWIATPVYVVLWCKPGLTRNYIWAFLLTLMICGNVVALMFSSVGPVYYDHFLGGDTFEGLQARLTALDQSGSALYYASYLLDSYYSRDSAFGTGISAIPSMHVAVAVLNAWLFSQMNRFAGVLAWGFALLIQFGSVYTGWHYAIDGYMSALLVTLIWAMVMRAHGDRLSVYSKRQTAPA